MMKNLITVDANEAAACVAFRVSQTDVSERMEFA